MKKIWNLISFDGKYITASLIYFGLGLFLIGITPNSQSIHAQSGCGGEISCPPGQDCCDGTCCVGTCVDGECCPNSL
ncbi:MAG: hypothetical protein LBQ66_09060 [Planctomycetaceae bacterium]|jgi:hypothetical protein|nr:hypothetical protein [Planctomycetaceae bacterium]